MGFFRDLIQRLRGGPAEETPAPADPIPPGPIPDESPPTDPIPIAIPVPEAAPAPLAEPIQPKVIAKGLGLDDGDFLPIGGSGLRAAAESLGVAVMRAFAVDRRDRIPPAGDERTRLIDRAMVAQGLLTPEELAEIHRVGAEMERQRGAIEAIEAQAGAAGAAAVELDHAGRDRVKAAKKAEAAERRRMRAEAIAERHANDIVYLGRGVSKFLGDRRSDLEALEARGLPPLSTPGDLAAAIGLPIPRLRWLAFHAEAATRVHYVSFEVPKKSGGTRLLSAPHKTLALAQRWILDHILARLDCEEPAHGFVAGRSILSNATPHARRPLVVNMDLEAFFPSIGLPRVRSVFRRLGYSPALATILGLLCTECPRRKVIYDGTTYFVATGPHALPQGACTSPALSNQVARRLDRRLAGLARKLDIRYTRYADDLTFSGDQAFDAKVGYLIARVRHLALAEGFVVNDAKTRVLRRNVAQVVTGLVVNDRPGVPRDEVRRLRAILHRARAEGLDAQNREGHPNFRAYLRGKIAYVGMSRPEVGRKLLDELEDVSGKEAEGEGGR